MKPGKKIRYLHTHILFQVTSVSSVRPPSSALLPTGQSLGSGFFKCQTYLKALLYLNFYHYGNHMALSKLDSFCTFVNMGIY